MGSGFLNAFFVSHTGLVVHDVGLGLGHGSTRLCSLKENIHKAQTILFPPNIDVIFDILSLLSYILQVYLKIFLQ